MSTLVTIKDYKYIKTLKVVVVEGRCPSKSAKGSPKYELRIKEKAKEQIQVPIETKVGVEIDLFYQGEENMPDIDNAEKLILDSLKGIAFHDDRQVVKSIKNVHDTTKVMHFRNQPVFLIDLLMEGVLEYTVIRIHEE